MRQADQMQVPYQWLLRSIGAELDALQASLFTIIEEPDVFTVRFHPVRNQKAMSVLRFTFEELLSRRTQLEGRRSETNASSEEAPLQPSGHQNMLRALGYELEHAHTYSILVEELEEGFFFSFQYLDPSQGYVPRKHLVVVDRGRREELLQEAYARRVPATNQRLLN